MNPRVRRLTFWDGATAAVVAGQLCLAWAIERFGPAGPVPAHFNQAGVVDRWGDRHEVVAMILVLAGLTLAVGIALHVVAKRALASGPRRTLEVGQLLLVFVPAAIGMMRVLQVFGAESPGSEGAVRNPGAVEVIWLILGVIGAVLGKVAPNPFIGVRTYGTFHSRLAWDKANRLAGRIFFVGGVAGFAISPWLDPRLTRGLLLTLVIIGVSAALLESWRVWRADPEKTP